MTPPWRQRLAVRRQCRAREGVPGFRPIAAIWRTCLPASRAPVGLADKGVAHFTSYPTWGHFTSESGYRSDPPDVQLHL